MHELHDMDTVKNGGPTVAAFAADCINVLQDEPGRLARVLIQRVRLS